jgi:threonine aldolase
MLRQTRIIPIFPNAVIERLEKGLWFHVWEKFDEQSSVVRLVTSWATPAGRGRGISNYT